MSLGPKSKTPDGNESDLPLWRKHFPIGSDDEASRSRREFIGGLSVAGGAMACGQVALNRVSHSETTEVKEYPPLVLEKKLGELNEGEALLFHYPNEKSPCLLVKFANEEFVAFAQKCTHLGCPVIPDNDANEFHCPCHHGSFDIRTGEPLAGPPRSALPKVRVEVADDGTLTAIGIG